MWPPGLTSEEMRPEAAVRIGRVMQHAVAQHDVELLRLEAGRNRFICTNRHAIEPCSRRNASPSRSEFRHMSVPITRRQEMPRKFVSCPVPQPTSSTVAVVRNALVQSSRILAAARLFDQRAHRIVIVVVRERRLLVERLDHLRHVARVVDLLVRPEQLRNAVVDRKGDAGIRCRRARCRVWLQLDADSTD